VIDFPSSQPASNSANMWNESALNNKNKLVISTKWGTVVVKKKKTQKKE
jgi:formylmethanofuran dehydrogenase subunit D